MKRLLIMLATALCIAVPAMRAHVGFGLRAGTNISHLRFNTDIFDPQNRFGYNAGLTMECIAPTVGLGFDMSVMYVHRGQKVLATADQRYPNLDANSDFVEIPVNLKFKPSLFSFSDYLRPFITTGPSLAVLCSDKQLSTNYENYKLDFAWNVGFGLEFFNHLQVTATYGIGLKETVKYVDLQEFVDEIKAKNRYWTVTAAYYF